MVGADRVPLVGGVADLVLEVEDEVEVRLHGVEVAPVLSHPLGCNRSVAPH